MYKILHDTKKNKLIHKILHRGQKGKKKACVQNLLHKKNKPLCEILRQEKIVSCLYFSTQRKNIIAVEYLGKGRIIQNWQEKPGWGWVEVRVYS